MTDRLYEQTGLTGIEWCIVAVIFGIIVAIFSPVVMERLAFDATADCQAKQMQPLRKPFSTQIRCVPIAPRGAGRDSLVVKVEKP